MATAPQQLRFITSLNTSAYIDPDMPNGPDTEKIGMTITIETKEWLLETYPDAASVQEAMRMAISDARIIQDGLHISMQE